MGSQGLGTGPHAGCVIALIHAEHSPIPGLPIRGLLFMLTLCSRVNMLNK
jgi:hypothetical protein